ncbi:MAG: DNA polymerase-3 subunit gamma/tau [Cocleimonas sp.]|jgi:DNA polymerase-3 subunit gamma/tau
MSYQVLARKWRPQNFKQMVGQEHVLRALMNALDSDRLHHAYLFTGTRGVGKTTIARILAKCLNCETGVTSTPCGECNSCKEIAAGNFLDLIEVDAASRTKVEDTRELLENVQYAPTRARFKVYLIDEVHMLTGHSFNALLKTLEEPPPHVKFLFATTDPQKLPATILSRCLQFNLKRMPADMITGHLEYLLNQESIKFEPSSLRLLARAADGSMRDALSLLDQAIAFSGLELTDTAVREMLGTISHEPLLDLLNLVISGEGATLLKRIEDLSSVTPDFDAATDALISLLHQLAVQQVVPDAINDEESIRELANKITKEEVQLFYQIALQGRRDLPLSPDPRSGFEMLLLRMMSFRPLREGMQLEIAERPSNISDPIDNSEAVNNSPDTSKKKTVNLKKAELEPEKNNTVIISSNTIEHNPEVINLINSDALKIEDESISSQDLSANSNKQANVQEHGVESSSRTSVQESVPPWEDLPPELEDGFVSSKKQKFSNDQVINNSVVEPKLETNNHSETVSLEDLLLAEPDVDEVALVDQFEQEKTLDDEETHLSEVHEKDEVVSDKTVNSSNDNKENKTDIIQPWYEVVPQLQLSGRANELIKHCLLGSHENDIVSLILDKDSQNLLAESTQQEIQTALIKFYGDNVRLDMTIAEVSLVTGSDNINETPAQRNDRKILESQQQAEHNIETDPFVCELQNRFGAQIVPGSIKVKQAE